MKDPNEEGFKPLSTMLEIPETSYHLQLGLINGRWASRILKGNNIIDLYIYKDEDIERGYPNLNLIVGWVFRTIAIPTFNPHQLFKRVQYLMKQARDRLGKDKGGLPMDFV